MAVRGEIPDTRMPIIAARGREVQIQQLKCLFPEAVTEDKVDFDKLKAILDEQGALATGPELYGFNWPGKNAARRIILEPSYGTLRPCPEESVEFDKAQNLFIEGDNLEVLKLLQNSYSRKIKMIYIDPPYNTGKEFIYPDNFREGLQDYLKYSGQVDDAGFKVSTNTETNGRYHSRWLSMMYPRLFLARNLLREDGVIFVSIDDNEAHNLRLVMNEIFGEENFLANISWQGMDTIKNDARYFSANCESVLAYSKNTDKTVIAGIKKTEKQRRTYKNYDDDPRGDYLLTPLHAKSGSEASVYEFTFPNGQVWKAPPGRYPRYSINSLQKLVDDERIYLDPTGKRTPQKKTYWSETGDRMRPPTFWRYEQFGSTRQGNQELREILGRGKFDNPKPLRLMTQIVNLLEGKDSIILDFFAGSCTMAHAVLKLNAEDGGNRKFICIQLPEPCGENSEAHKAGYKTIADIGKERIRRAIKKLESDSSEKLNLQGNGKVQAEQAKMGFKVFKLGDSNFKLWEPGEEPDAKSLAEQIKLFAQNLKSGRSEQDFLYELLLSTGQTLTTSIEEKQIAGQKAFFADEGALVICLGDGVTREFFQGIIAQKPEQVVCLDNSFAGNDSLKTNVVLEMKSNNIQFWTV